MIGLLIQLAISWLLLWFFERKDLRALGIVPTGQRLSQLIFGILSAAFCCAVYFWIKMSLEKSDWSINADFRGISFLKSGWWVMNSVLFEELIFRGALLVMAIRFLGINKAVIISALCFGVYHWFSFGVFGNPIPMIFVFLMTGLWGYMFAMAFAKTTSLYFPIGLHFGWNFISIVIFSNGPLGEQFLKISGTQPLVGLFSLVVFFIQTFMLPLVVFLYLRYFSKSNSAQI